MSEPTNLGRPEPGGSIVPACRNERAHIEACLYSVVNQLEQEGGFEVIVADGMSNDGTREILQRIAAASGPVISSPVVSGLSSVVSSPLLHSAVCPPSSVLHPPSSSASSLSTSDEERAGVRCTAELSTLNSQPSTTRAVVRIIDNPGFIVSKGLNAAIRAARGEIIIRIDAHTEYAPDYVRSCVATLEATGADNVGGPARTKAHAFIEKAVAAAYHSPFAVGGAKFHNVEYEGFVDTVTYGCWPRGTFEKFGLFDEELARNQDDEHNLRIARGGGKIYQSPKIKSWYRPRGSLMALFRQYMQYGYWKVRVIEKHKLPASPRHLVPGAFVLTLMLLSLTSVLCHLSSVFGAPSSVIDRKSTRLNSSHVSESRMP